MSENVQVQLLKIIFSKTFFFDKYQVNNIYQYPQINTLELKFFISAHFGLNKFKLAKIVLLFYMLTGQRPKFLTKIYNVRNIKRTKIVGLLLTMHQYSYFFSFLVQRQLSLSTTQSFQSLVLTHESTFTFEVTQRVYDDDILFQALKLLDILKYQISLKSTSLVREHLRSLLIGFKIPCKK